MCNENIENTQRQLWNKKHVEFNEDYKALGSETNEHKTLRYSKIAQIFDMETNIKILDIGAGFGDFYNFIKQTRPDAEIAYTGTEITEQFIEIGKKKYPDIDLREINILNDELKGYDYVICSGIFHQYGATSLDAWTEFMFRMISKMFFLAEKGIAFNVLSDLVDFKKNGNFYPNSFDLQSFIKTNLTRFMQIDLSYPLFETTYHLYKPGCIKKKFNSKEFKKYLK